jgi:hypothetical protein
MMIEPTTTALFAKEPRWWPLVIRPKRNPLLAAGMASILAGPIFLVAASIAFTLKAFLAGSLSLTGVGDAALSAPILFALSLPFGFCVSILPDTAGSVLLGFLGMFLPSARSWIMWSLIGAVTALFVAKSLNFGGQAWDVVVPYSVTGAACASICRYFTSWTPRQSAC